MALSVHGFTESIILFSNSIEIENCQFLVFPFLIWKLKWKFEIIFDVAKLNGFLIELFFAPKVSS